MLESLRNWVAEAQNQLPEGQNLDFNLCYPNPRFRYPEYPKFPVEESNDPSGYLKRIVSGTSGDDVVLFEDLASLMRSTLGFFKKEILSKSQKIPRLATFRPPSPELYGLCRELGLEVYEISRDPGEWPISLTNLFLKNSHPIFYFHHPGTADGFALPPTHLFELLSAISNQFSESPIFFDESLALFTFDAFPSGRLADIPRDHKVRQQIFQINSVYPGMAPAGPETAWVRMPKKSVFSRVFFPTQIIPEEDVVTACRAYLAFSQKQGPAIAEFHRRMLAVQRGLRGLADMLGPFIREQKIDVPLWPTQGFFLTLKHNLNKNPGGVRFPTARSLALAMSRDFRILVLPGDFFDAPDHIRLCFATPLPTLEKATERLRRAFEAML